MYWPVSQKAVAAFIIAYMLGLLIVGVVGGGQILARLDKYLGRVE